MKTTMLTQPSKMNHKSLLVFLPCFLLLLFYTQITEFRSICNKEPLKCCTNYRRVGNRCEECFPGSYGENCDKTCPDGFYGKLCTAKCNCMPCSKIYGCVQNSSITEDNDWHFVSIYVSGSAGLCFIFGYSAYCILRKHRYTKPSDLQEDLQENNVKVKVSNGSLQLNPNETNLTSEECLENFAVTKERHLSSKRQNRAEGLLTDMCLKEKVCSRSEDAENTSNTSENIYSHLNMNDLQYNMLNHTSESEQSNIGMHSSSLQEASFTGYNINNEISTKCTGRQSFLYPDDAFPKVGKDSLRNDSDEKSNVPTLNNVSAVSISDIQNSESFSVIREARKPSKKEKLEKKMHMDEMSKMLENFKPKTQELENNTSKASITHRQRASKKTKKKLLRYSFAPSMEIAE